MKRQWRCRRCGKLLGIVEENRLHIQFARGHQYLVGLPATSACRGCKTLNELATLEELGKENKDIQSQVKD